VQAFNKESRFGLLSGIPPQKKKKKKIQSRYHTTGVVDPYFFKDLDPSLASIRLLIWIRLLHFFRSRSGF
jgi:hypothetical protein